MKATATKTVTILVRYFVKASQTVICQVLNGEGKKYFVTLHKNGNTTCTCKHGETAGNYAHCYHVKHVQSVEASNQQPVLTPAATLAGYDVVGAALTVVNACRNELAAGDAYELIAAKWEAINSVPSFIERQPGVGCEYCGKNHSSATCPF